MQDVAMIEVSFLAEVQGLDELQGPMTDRK